MTDASIGARLVDLLTDEDSAIFGVPGGQTLPLYGASAAAGRRHVLVRDERNAACAADAFARVTGTVGLCDATVGPGVTNLVSGMAEAYASSVPLVAIIADIRRDVEHLRHRSVVSQAVDQDALLAPVSKWIGRVHQAEAIEEIVDHALRVATTGRPGPVVVEIPEDIFLGSVETPRRRAVTAADRRFPRYRPYPSPAEIDDVVRLLEGAERPLLIAGGGVTWSGAAAAVARLASDHCLPVVTTLNGKGAISECDALSAGVMGGFGTVRGNLAVRAADLLIAIGTKFDQQSSHAWRLPAAGQRLVHVDIDGEEIGRAIPAEVGVVADAASFADALHAALGHWSAPTAPWTDEVAPAVEREPDGDDRVHPIDVVQALDDVMQPDDLLVCDASLSSGWAAAHFRVKTPGVGMIAPRGLAGLGWAPGAALGARFGRPLGKVVVLSGDGAWGYGMAEIETASRLSLDITYVILNNAALGWIRHTEAAMKLKSKALFSEVDFAKAAQALGAAGRVVVAGDDVVGAIAAGVSTPGPCLIDVRSSATASPTVRFGAVRRSPYA